MCVGWLVPARSKKQSHTRGTCEGGAFYAPPCGTEQTHPRVATMGDDEYFGDLVGRRPGGKGPSTTEEEMQTEATGLLITVTQVAVGYQTLVQCSALRPRCDDGAWGSAPMRMSAMRACVRVCMGEHVPRGRATRRLRHPMPPPQMHTHTLNPRARALCLKHARKRARTHTRLNTPRRRSWRP